MATKLRLHRAACALLVTAIAGLAAACQEDPQYVQAPMAIESDPANPMGVTMTLTLPIELESRTDADERTALATELGMPPDQVPYVRVDDFDVSVEYAITNLSDQDGQAFVDINGGNQFFFYVPEDFVVDPEEDEPPPPLMGGFPINVRAGRTVADVVREDEVREASIDLELITRGGLHPFAALLEIHEDVTEWQPVAPIDPMDPAAGTMPVGTPISVRAFGQIVRFDVVFTASQPMRLEMDVRIRDHRNILHPRLLDAPAEEIVMFAPMQYTPPGAAP